MESIIRGTLTLEIPFDVLQGLENAHNSQQNPVDTEKHMLGL